MDIRLRELELLAEIDRRAPFTVGPFANGPGLERDLVAFLASNRYVNDFDVPWSHDERLSIGLPGESELERSLHSERIKTLSKIMGGRDVSLRITHAGRVRMAELSQVLRSGKLREQNGVLWDGRHFAMDLRVGLLDASESNPVSVAYLDLNSGLKPVNDTMGHDAGDILLRAYFHDVAGAVTDRGDAYRLGGDEVVCLVPACSREDAIEIVRRICLLLQNEHLQFAGEDLPPLSVAVGITVNTAATISAEQVRNKAEVSMYKAKEFTKGQSPRPSSFAIEGEVAVQVVK